LVANQGQVRRALVSLREILDGWDSALEEGAVERLSIQLQQARNIRRAMGPPVVAVGVVMQDRPGALGAVGRALVATGVDVRDLQLRHGPHKGRLIIAGGDFYQGKKVLCFYSDDHGVTWQRSEVVPHAGKMAWASESKVAELPDGTPCDDADLCTQSDSCMAGTCVGTFCAVMSVVTTKRRGSFFPSGPLPYQFRR